MANLKKPIKLAQLVRHDSTTAKRVITQSDTGQFYHKLPVRFTFMQMGQFQRNSLRSCRSAVDLEHRFQSRKKHIARPMHVSCKPNGFRENHRKVLLNTIGSLYINWGVNSGINRTNQTVNTFTGTDPIGLISITNLCTIPLFYNNMYVTLNPRHTAYCTAVYREWRYQMLWWYNLSSWRWTCWCSKHVEDCNIYIVIE